MSTPRAVLVAGLTLSVVAVPAALLAWGWFTQWRERHDDRPDRPDPETLKADLEAAPQTPDARALKRLVRPPLGRATWADLDREHLDLAHRISRAVSPEQQRQDAS